MRNYKAKNIDQYIKEAPLDAQPHLNELRNIFKKELKDAEEVIAWGIPFYKKDEYIVGFTNLNGYVSFGFTKTFNEEIKKEFEKKGYKTTMKTIKIYFNQEVPRDLVIKALK
jgi:uncharacterized protein YdhG (YjbR/CyaY superfamily)